MALNQTAIWLGYTAYLQRGTAVFRLDDANQIELTPDFVPPATQESPLLAFGSSANRYGGSTKVGETANDVEFTLPVLINGTSEAQVRLVARHLASFLKSGTPDLPVYFCWLGNDDIGTEPFYGQYGHFRAMRLFMQAHPK
ncbi:MAG: hypothetical protein HC804_09585 [Anaerolineae bacterium]|nr:hypothetical protein [Anaerolineae bacterium]